MDGLLKSVTGGGKLSVFLFAFLIVTFFLLEKNARVFGSVKNPAGIRVRIGSDSIDNVSSEFHEQGHALLIGVEQYTAGWPDAIGVGKEIAMVADGLEKMGFSTHQRLNATSRQLRNAIEEFFTKFGTKNDSRLLIYFSGHGYSMENRAEGYFVPSDAPHPVFNPNGFSRKALPFGQVKNWAISTTARHILFVFDSCVRIFEKDSAENSEKGEKPEREVNFALPARKYLIHCNTGRSYTFREEFAKAFLDAVRSPWADLNKDGYVSVGELGNYVENVLVEKTAYEVRFGTLPGPVLSKGEFLFKVGHTRAASSEKAPDAALAVQCSEKDAKVLLNGRFIGNTDIAHITVPSGRHVLEVKKEGFRPYQETLVLKPGQSDEVFVSLMPDWNEKSRLFVNTDPLDAQVEILDSPLEFSQGIVLEPGRYHLVIRSENYETKDVWVTLMKGEVKRLNILLSKASGQGSLEKVISNDLEMKFVFIPENSFLMGSPGDEIERDSDESLHRVRLTRGFFMQTTEVTQGQWRMVMGSNPSRFQNCGLDCPVESVSWEDVQVFIRKLNQREPARSYRLPTEAEWEYAARADTLTPFAFGLCLSTNQANYDGNYPLYGCPAGQYRASPISVGTLGANKWGLHDMHGNVEEWCADWYGPYPQTSVTDPTGPTTGQQRVLRGGSWIIRAANCRSADRGKDLPNARYHNTGFRLVLVPGS